MSDIKKPGLKELENELFIQLSENFRNKGPVPSL